VEKFHELGARPQMDGFQALQTYAEVSATLVGLIAVIVVLRGRAQRAWSKAELFGAIDVLMPGLMATISALIAIALLASFGDTAFSWRTAHGLFGLVHLLGPITFWSRPPETRVTFGGKTAVVFGTGSTVIIIGNFAIAGGFLLEIAPIVYFVALTWVILVNIWAFGTMLVDGGHEGD
jgi:hypothetical protein